MKARVLSGAIPARGAKKNNRMEIFNGNICVTVAELTDSSDGNAVMSYKNYNILAFRNRLSIVRPGKGLDSYAHIDWQTLPERFRKKYIAKYGDQEKKLREAERAVKYDEKAFEFFSTATTPDGKAIKEDKIEEYTWNASVLNRLLECHDIQKSSRALAGNPGTPIAWSGIAAESEKLRDECGHTLPKSEARLKDKMRRYRAEGYACLISSKLSNTNSSKLTPEGEELIIAWKRSQFPRYTNMQIFEEYNSVAMERGWKPLKSSASITNFPNRPDIRMIWEGGANGSLSLKKRIIRRHTTVLPQLRDSIWYGDGTKLNLYYKALVNGRWKVATLYVFEVIDAYSEIFLGYKIGTSEDFNMMYWAYRNAFEFAGHLPVELIHDGQGGSKRYDAKEWMSKLSKCTRPCTPQNPTSKTIEAIFGRFQGQVLYRNWNYTGGNITAKSEATKIDVDRIIANIEALPTYDELLKTYAEARMQWNSMTHPKYGRPRIDLYRESVNPESTALNPSLMRNLFWLTTKDEVTFTADGLKIQIDNETYRYEVFGKDGMPDLDWNARNIGNKFVVQYDPGDKSVVRLCRRDPNYGLQFITEAKPKIVVHRAMQEQTEEERAFIRRQQHAGKRQQVFLYLDGNALDRKYGQAFDQHGMRDPKLPGVTAKEFEQYAEEWTRLHSEPEPAAVLPDTIGKVEKEISNITQDSLSERSVYSRM